MFEIGSSLREARLRQQLEFPQIEQATKIRGKYLRALEDEQFEILPGQTYVKGFLRTYAEYLGLDGQLYVDEYNSRYVTGEDEPPLSARSGRGYGRAGPRFESNVVLVALAAIAVLTALVIAAWKFGGDTPDTGIPNLPAGPPAKQPAPKRPQKRPAVANARLTVTARYGDCWLEVHAGSASGELVHEGTLEFGQTRTFTRKRLWLSIGRPANLTLRLNGRPRALPGSGVPRIVVVTARGIALAPRTA